MKIAVCCESGGSSLAPFGRGAEVSIWTVEGTNIVGREAVNPQGGCCGGLARSVAGVDVVLCSAIGYGAMGHLVEQGTSVAMPVEPGGNAEDVMRLWLSGASDRFHVQAGECGHPAGGCHSDDHLHHEHQN